MNRLAVIRHMCRGSLPGLLNYLSPYRERERGKTCGAQGSVYFLRRGIGVAGALLSGCLGIDHASGKSDDRPNFKRRLEDARRRRSLCEAEWTSRESGTGWWTAQNTTGDNTMR